MLCVSISFVACSDSDNGGSMKVKIGKVTCNFDEFEGDVYKRQVLVVPRPRLLDYIKVLLSRSQSLSLPPLPKGSSSNRFEGWNHPRCSGDSLYLQVART